MKGALLTEALLILAAWGIFLGLLSGLRSHLTSHRFAVIPPVLIPVTAGVLFCMSITHHALTLPQTVICAVTWVTVDMVFSWLFMRMMGGVNAKESLSRREFAESVPARAFMYCCGTVPSAMAVIWRLACGTRE